MNTNIKFKKIILLIGIIFRTIAITIKSKLSRNTYEKSLAILRLDGIGDYIVFRNFLEKLRHSELYKDYTITLIGNTTWKDFAEQFDSEFIDHFIWIDLNLVNDLNYYKKVIKQLSTKGFETIIIPNYSRLAIAEEVAMVISAKHKILSNGNLDRIKSMQSYLSFLFIDKVINFPPEITSEFMRNKYFMEKIIGNKINIKAPYLAIEKPIINDYNIVIFPGAHDPKRVWPISKFISLIHKIIYSTGFKIIIVGGKSEINNAAIIVKHFNNDKIINKVNQTTLVELVYLLSNASLVISNESSSLHIASAVKTPSVCLLGGGHYGRFVPYDSDMVTSTSPIAVCHYMECYNCNWQCKYPVNIGESYPCMSKIDEEAVYTAITKILPLNTLLN